MQAAGRKVWLLVSKDWLEAMYTAQQSLMMGGRLLCAGQYGPHPSKHCNASTIHWATLLILQINVIQRCT